MDLVTNTWSFYLAIVLGILIALYVFGTYRFDQFKGYKNVPTPWAFPFIGHLFLLMRDGMRKTDHDLIKHYGKCVGLYWMKSAHILTTDTEIIKQAYVKEAGSFLDRNDFGLSGYPFRRSITLLAGDDWKRVRSLITPTFTSNKMRKIAPLIMESVQSLTKIFEGHAEKQNDIDTKEVFGGLTMEVSARTMFAMDIHIQDDPKNVFTKHASAIFGLKSLLKTPFVLLVLMVPQLSPIFLKFFPAGTIPEDANNFFVNICKRSMETRKDNFEIDSDLLALLMKAHSEELEHQQQVKTKDKNEVFGDWMSETASASRGLTTEEIIAQAMIFMLAGYDTTASTLDFCSYYLAMNPDIQEKCYREIMRELGDEALTYDNCTKLVYLDQCIQETLRFAPPTPRIQRIASEDIVLTRETGEPLPVPKGMSLQIPITVMHMDPQVWEEPEKFSPDRFLLEEKKKRNPFYYAPFGIGPRNCVGMRFANLAMKMSLASVIRAVRLVPCDKTEKSITFNTYGMKPLKPIILRSEKRV